MVVQYALLYSKHSVREFLHQTPFKGFVKQQKH